MNSGAIGGLKRVDSIEFQGPKSHLNVWDLLNEIDFKKDQSNTFA
jgi:hypothetical protein